MFSPLFRDLLQNYSVFVTQCIINVSKTFKKTSYITIIDYIVHIFLHSGMTHELRHLVLNYVMLLVSSFVCTLLKNKNIICRFSYFLINLPHEKGKTIYTTVDAAILAAMELHVHQGQQPHPRHLRLLSACHMGLADRCGVAAQHLLKTR